MALIRDEDFDAFLGCVGICRYRGSCCPGFNCLVAMAMPSCQSLKHYIVTKCIKMSNTKIKNQKHLEAASKSALKCIQI